MRSRGYSSTPFGVGVGLGKADEEQIALPGQLLVHTASEADEGAARPAEPRVAQERPDAAQGSARCSFARSAPRPQAATEEENG